MKESCTTISTFSTNSSNSCPLPQITMVCSMLHGVVNYSN